ncbi:unnamed protein product [Schistocephalus solidus]|uniref:RNA-binding protein 12B n=1 Tax=Schistocephalus solidus TaxID=70667 RepID=A0A183SNN4_SCHSO|nr:unnamed protein product [Schistocephalus solidus]
MAAVIIRLQNLPMSANTSSIRRFFGGLNIPEGGVHIVGGDDGDAFIAFATDEDARKAMLLDRQTINSAVIRLFLSSKAEMQSVIESARNSVMFPTGNTPTLQVSHLSRPEFSKIPETTQSVPAYNGSVHSSEKVISHDPYASYGYPSHPAIPDSFQSSARPTPDPISSLNLQFHRISQPSVATTSSEPPGDPKFDYEPRHWSHSSSERMPSRPFKQVPFPDSSIDVVSEYQSRPSNPESTAKSANRLSSTPSTFTEQRVDYGYAPYHNAYADRKPQESLVRPEFTSPSNSLPLQNDHSSDQMTYQNPPYSTDIPVTGYENRVQERMPPPDRPPRETPVPRKSEERDFSVRPPWLGEEPVFPKRTSQFDDSEKGGQAPPFKRMRPGPMSQELGSDTNFVSKVSLHPPDVSVKAIFDILQGVSIIPRWGIRLEEDVLKRFTGYVYVMMNGHESMERALSFNGTSYKGRPVKVAASSPEEFYRVTDTNFELKCPPDVHKKIPPRSTVKPPYFTDGCLEICDLPPDATPSEVVAFLGAPGLNVNDVAVISPNYGESKGPRAIVRLPSPKDLDILLSARPRPFRGNQGSPVRLLAISRLQYDFFTSRSAPKPPESRSSVPRPEPKQQPVPTGPKTCALVSGFSRTMKPFEVSRLFPSVIIPGDAIRTLPGGRAAVIDFISESNCKKAVSDYSASEAKLRESNSEISMQTITRSEFESKLHEVAGPDPPVQGDSYLRPHQSNNTEREAREFRPPARDNIRFPPHQPYASDAPRFRPPSQLRPPFFDEKNGPPTRPEPFQRRPEPFGGSRPPRPPHPSGLSPVRPEFPRGVPLYISNLSPATSPEMLLDIFRQYYPLPGSIRLRRDARGHPMGEAMVVLPSNSEAERAVRELSGYRIYGRNMILRHERDE